MCYAVQEGSEYPFDGFLKAAPMRLGTTGVDSPTLGVEASPAFEINGPNDRIEISRCEPMPPKL